jgi:MoaA/NifB/PqqE/SkfB family radical SAM enzyme
MIRELTGIDPIRMLYVQLMYRCNFSCKHCFHGELLTAKDSFTSPQVNAILRYFRARYSLEAVTFLGGEPLLYPEILSVCRTAKSMGLTVELCTNGHHGFHQRIKDIAPYVDKLRISLEGLEDANDHIRQPGSFLSALQTIELARTLGTALGVTMTVTATNLKDVLPLAQLLESLGVRELKLHSLRAVGNAAEHPELFILDNSVYGLLQRDIRNVDLKIELLYDTDLSPHPHSDACAISSSRSAERLDRIELDPQGGLTMSCKAVGRNAQAFRWDKQREVVFYEPHANDELAQHVPDVVYQTT